MVEETFAKSRVEEMIRENGDVESVVPDFQRSGFDLFKLSNASVIRIRSDHSRYTFEEVSIIAEDKLGMSQWALEKWLADQG